MVRLRGNKTINKELFITIRDFRNAIHLESAIEIFLTNEGDYLQAREARRLPCGLSLDPSETLLKYSQKIAGHLYKSWGLN